MAAARLPKRGLNFSTLGESTQGIAMAVRPERVEDWFHLAPGLLSQDGWETSFARPLSTLSHCVSPWGGHLIRFSYQDITIADAPENTAGVVVRPEVRAWVHSTNPSPGSSFEVLNQLAPGDAVVKRWASWGLLRLCSVLSGTLLALHELFLLRPGEANRISSESATRLPRAGGQRLRILRSV